MSFIRLLMGRRKFLVGSASAALSVAFGRIAGVLGLLSQTHPAKALDKPKPIVDKKLKGIVVYYSSTGNTAQIANALYKGMKSVISCDVVPVMKMNPKKMAKYDVMAIGAPNWYMREPAVMRTFTDDMPRMDGKHCVIFGTHGMSPQGQFWSLSFNPLRKGMTIIGWSDWSGPDFVSPHHGVPHAAWGHPDNIDLAEAEAFGRKMAEYSIRIYGGETDLIPKIPTPGLGEDSLWSPRQQNGNLTFASPPPDSVPQFDLSKCVYPRCTQCQDNCPVNAIDLSVMARAGSITGEAVVTQDQLFAQDWSVHPKIGQAYPLVVKNACAHCGGLCQRVCRYDAIAYLGEKIHLIINTSKCAYPKCTICSDLCHQKSIDLTKNPPVIHNNCEAEALCWGVCPYNAIEVPNMAEVQLKKAWWFKEIGMGAMTPNGPAMNQGMAGGRTGSGGGGAPMSGPESSPRFRSLVRKEDEEHSFQVMFITKYPRVPIKSDLWPEHIDDNS
jgi:ferredoxin